MKTSFFIAGKFIKAHKGKFILSILIISLFIAAFESTLIYNNSYIKTVENNTLKEYGEETGIIYNADIGQSEQFLSETSEGMTGFCGYDEIYSDTLDNKFYIGYMPESVLKSKHRAVTEGRLPEKEGEAAVEENAYSALGLTAKIGESFTVTVQQNGKPAEKSFILCGKVESYLLNWQRSDISKKSFTFPPPVVLTAKSSEQAPSYINIMCADVPESGKYFGGEFSDTSITLSSSSVKAESDLVYRLTIPLGVFFILVMILGIYGVLQYIMDDYDKYVRLLGCIGMPLKKCIPIYLVIALTAIISSSVLGSILGAGISFLFCGAISWIALGKQILFFYDIGYAVSGCAICAVVILAVFLISICKYYLSFGKESDAKKHRRFSKRTVPFEQDIRLKKLWKKAQSKKYFSQRLLSFILIFACVIVAGFMLFESQQLLIFSNQSVTMADESFAEDFILYIPGGGSNTATYNINQPEGSGVMPKNLKELADAGLKIKYSSVGYNISAFVFYDTSSHDPSLDRLFESGKPLTEEEIPTLRYALEAAGGSEEDYLLERDYGYGDWGFAKLNYDGMLGDLGVTDMDREAFESGKSIAAPEKYFDIGDKVTILTVSSVDPEKSKYDPEKFLFHKDEYTVGALTESTFVLCADYLSTIHKTAGYNEVYLSVPDLNDEESVEAATKAVENVVAKSQYTAMDNIIQEREDYKVANKSSIMSIVIMLCIFELMTITAVIVSSKLKTKSDMNSLTLLNEIGADSDLLIKLSAASNMKIAIFAGGAATILTAIIAISTAIKQPFLPLIPITVLSIALSAFLTAFTAVFSYMVSRREITRANRLRNAQKEQKE